MAEVKNQEKPIIPPQKEEKGPAQPLAEPQPAKVESQPNKKVEEQPKKTEEPHKHSEPVPVQPTGIFIDFL